MLPALPISGSTGPYNGDYVSSYYVHQSNVHLAENKYKKNKFSQLFLSKVLQKYYICTKNIFRSVFVTEFKLCILLLFSLQTPLDIWNSSRHLSGINI